MTPLQNELRDFDHACITELESKIADLERDNAALRTQLATRVCPDCLYAGAASDGEKCPMCDKLYRMEMERNEAREQLATVRAETFERCAAILAKYRHTPYIDVDLIIAMFRTAAKEASP